MREGCRTGRGAALMACAVAVALAAGGCAARKGGWFGRSSEEPPPPAPISEEGLAGKPSIEQFEQTGTVRPGGTFEDVHFAFDSAQLDEAAMEVVRRNAELLRANPTSKVEIEGHCDERGTSEYNLALGSRRARAVRDALVGLGISADRLTTVSYGEELPLCKESTEECWAQNRRAHLVEVSR